MTQKHERALPVPTTSLDWAFIYLFAIRNVPVSIIRQAIDIEKYPPRHNSVISSIRHNKFGWSVENQRVDFKKAKSKPAAHDPFWQMIEDPQLNARVDEILTQLTGRAPEQTTLLLPTPLKEEQKTKVEFGIVHLDGNGSATLEPEEPVKITVEQGDKKYVSYTNAETALNAHIKIARTFD